MKKTLITILSLAIIAGAAAAVWAYISFKGNAVIESSELYVSKRSNYTELIDSLKPRIGHHFAFDL